jgi:predicted TIM-barrel fold metal-dependent hydrolase
VKWVEELGWDCWFFGDQPVAPAAIAATAGFEKFPPSQPARLSDVHKNTWDAVERLKLMDAYGIHTASLFPNVSGFGMGRFTYLKDPELMLACIQAYNDFLTDFCSIAPDRYLANSALPFWDVDLSREEMKRCAEMGHRGIVFGSRPAIFEQPPIGDRHWDPVFAQAQEMGLPVNFHIAAGSGPMRHAAMTSFAWRARENTMLCFENAGGISEIIACGVCHRFPDLKFVAVESGVGWIPFLLEVMDYSWKIFDVARESPEFDLLPSEYFARQVYGTFSCEAKGLPATIDQIGDENILFSTDFPHESMDPSPTFHPDAPPPGRFISEPWQGLSDDSLRKLLHDNAAKLYGVK